MIKASGMAPANIAIVATNDRTRTVNSTTRNEQTDTDDRGHRELRHAGDAVAAGAAAGQTGAKQQDKATDERGDEGEAAERRGGVDAPRKARADTGRHACAQHRADQIHWLEAHAYAARESLHVWQSLEQRRRTAQRLCHQRHVRR